MKVDVMSYEGGIPEGSPEAKAIIAKVAAGQYGAKRVGFSLPSTVVRPSKAREKPTADAMVAFREWFDGEFRKLNMTMKDIERTYGIRVSSIQKYRRGQSMPSALTCDKIAEAFGLPAEEVRERAGRR